MSQAGDSWWEAPVEKGPKGLVKLLVGKGCRQTTLTCDKATLAANSPYFAAQIVRDMNSDLPEWIPLPDEDAITVNFLLQCMVGRCLEPGSLPVSETLRAFATAKKFQMDVITQKLRNDLAKVAKGKESIDILEAARRFGDEDLKRSALEYIVPRFSMLLKSPHFLKLSRSSICELLKNEDVIVDSELEVFSAVIKWTEEECKRLCIDATNNRKFQAVMGEMSSLIRYPTMKPEIFDKFVSSRDILQRQDYELLEHYWRLLYSDPVSAESMHLPFDKGPRVGRRYFANFFLRKVSESQWIVEANHWCSIKLQSDTRISVHCLLLYGKPKGSKVVQAHILLTEKMQGKKNRKGHYSTVSTEEGTVCVTRDGISSRLDLQKPLVLVQGRKYLLKICFIKSDFESNSCGTKSGTPPTPCTTKCGNQGYVRIVVKKVKGADCLFHSLDFTVLPLLNKDTDKYYVPRAKIKVQEVGQNCIIA